MFQLEIIIHLILNDKLTKEKWKTPNHHEDKKDDDWHGPGGIKEAIIKEIENKLKKKYGDNCDILIKKGVIFIESQKYDDTGVKTKKSENTRINAEEYFERILRFIVNLIIEEVPLTRFKNLTIEKTIKNKKDKIIFLIELSIK